MELANFWKACISIVVAVFIAMIGIGIENPHQSNIYAVTPSRLTSWSAGVVGVSNIVVSFSGHVAFFGISGLFLSLLPEKSYN